MKNIKTYEDFVNEEVNLRKGLMGAALGASLLANTGCGPSETEKYYARKNAEYQSQVDFDNQMSEVGDRLEINRKSNIKSITLPIEILNIPKGWSVDYPKNITIKYTNSGDLNSDEYKFINIVHKNINNIIDTLYIDLSEDLSEYGFPNGNYWNWSNSRDDNEYNIQIQPRVKSKYVTGFSNVDYFFKYLFSTIKNYNSDYLSEYLSKLSKDNNIIVDPELNLCDDSGEFNSQSSYIDLKITKK